MNQNINKVNELIKSCHHLDRIHYKKYDELKESYFNKNVPCVITGLSENWKTKKWSLDFFKTNYGSIKLNLARQNYQTGDIEKKEMLMSDYIDYIVKNDSKPEDVPFYNNTDFNPPKELYPDYDLPEYFNCMFNNLKNIDSMATLSWIYLAPKNSITKLHKDVANTSAWNLVISGIKFWVFYPEDQVKYLYNGNVNPFNPDLYKHPLYYGAKPIVCVQKPGEIVYTPAGMYHAVLNMEKGVSLTENYICEQNLKLVQQYCLENQINLPQMNHL